MTGPVRQALPAHRLPHPEHSVGLLLLRHWRHSGDGNAPAWRWLAIPLGHGGRGQELLRWCQDLQGDIAEGHPCREVLVVHPLRQHVALDARYATALPACGQPGLPITRG